MQFLALSFSELISFSTSDSYPRVALPPFEDIDWTTTRRNHVAPLTSGLAFTAPILVVFHTTSQTTQGQSEAMLSESWSTFFSKVVPDMILKPSCSPSAESVLPDTCESTSLFYPDLHCPSQMARFDRLYSSHGRRACSSCALSIEETRR